MQVWSAVSLFLGEISLPPNTWIIGNTDYMGFYRTNYDEALWKKLTTQLHEDHLVTHYAFRVTLLVIKQDKKISLVNFIYE